MVNYMHITTIEIHNFRSIKKLSINVRALTVLAGENNAGKSNILRALDVFFNPHKEIVDDDFHYDITPKLMVMKVGLSNISALVKSRLGLGKDVNDTVIHFRYSRRSGRIYKILNAPDIIEERQIRLAFREFFVYIPPLRDVAAQLDMESGKLFASVISRVAGGISTQHKRSLEKSTKEGFKTLNSLINREVEPLISAIKKFLPDIEPRFSLSSELHEVLSLLRLQVSEDGADTPLGIQFKGHGFHSLVVLALYSHAIQRSNTGGVLAIEEPELHLHPNLQRQYAVLMRRISGKRVQILCTTHSGFLINQINIKGICKIAIDNNETKAYQPSPKYIETEILSLEKNMTDLWSELFLTRFVVLVEGASERQSLPKWASKIRYTTGQSEISCTFASNSIGVYDVGSCSNYSNIMKFLGEYKIPFAVLTDFDALERGKLIQQLRSAGVVSPHEQKIYTNWVKGGEVRRAISSLRRKMVYIAEKDYEDLIVDEKSKTEVEKVIREYANEDFTKYCENRTRQPQQILSDFQNQVANRIHQFKSRLGMKRKYTQERELEAMLKKSFASLYEEANAGGDINVKSGSDVDSLKGFIKTNKVFWHVRISRSSQTGSEPKALVDMITDIVRQSRRPQIAN